MYHKADIVAVQIFLTELICQLLSRGLLWKPVAIRTVNFAFGLPSLISFNISGKITLLGTGSCVVTCDQDDVVFSFAVLSDEVIRSVLHRIPHDLALLFLCMASMRPVKGPPQPLVRNTDCLVLSSVRKCDVCHIPPV